MEVRSEPRDEVHALRLERALRTERARLVRWCWYLTGNLAVAEDLAQETCAAAWRNAKRPEHAEEYGAWLGGIARNICRSWRRSQRREASQAFPLAAGEADGAEHLADLTAGTDDLAEIIERKELALLLDRALTFVPAETREALVAKYIEEAPLAEVAARMRVSESALAARLHRGKLALRQVLATELRVEAQSYGLAPAEDDGWHETRIWCPECGARRFMVRLTPETDTFALHCPLCYARDRIDFARWSERSLFSGLSSHRVALSRLSRSAHHLYRQSLSDGATVCVRCHASAILQQVGPEKPGTDFHLRVVCARCATTYSATLSGILFCHPQTQRFWRAHPRMTTLPDSAIEFGGQSAALTCFVSWDGAARLEFISDPRTFAIWNISGMAPSANV